MRRSYVDEARERGLVKEFCDDEKQFVFYLKSGVVCMNQDLRDVYEFVRVARSYADHGMCGEHLELLNLVVNGCDLSKRVVEWKPFRDERFKDNYFTLEEVLFEELGDVVYWLSD